MQDQTERPRRRVRIRWRRVGSVALALLVLAVALARWDPFYEPPLVELTMRRPLGTDGVRLMTLNCAHGRATSFHQALTREAHVRRNLGAIARVIKAINPDVVALQELDAPSTWSGGFDHLAYLGELTGYSYSYHGLHVDRSSLPKLAYGTGVLSRLPLSNGASHAFAMNRLDTKGFVYVEVETPGLPLALVSVHLDFKRDSERRRQLAALTTFLEDRGRTHSLVVTGDFNTNVDASGGVLAAFAQANGLSSPADCLPTFPARRPTKALDDILLAQGLEATSKRALNVLVSDHLPLVVDLRGTHLLSSPRPR